MALRLRRRRKLYKMLVGSHKAAADKIYTTRTKVLGGYLLAVDPASVSLGYALFQSGILVKSGSIQAKGDIGKRLAKLTTELKKQVEDVEIDVLAIEFLRGGVGHNYLIWSAGAVVSSVLADHVVEVHSQSWKKLITKAYKKSDENDAIMIGKFVVELCKETE